MKWVKHPSKWHWNTFGFKIIFALKESVYDHPKSLFKYMQIPRSLVVSDLRSETKGSRFESGC